MGNQPLHSSPRRVAGRRSPLREVDKARQGERNPLAPGKQSGRKRTLSNSTDSQPGLYTGAADVNMVGLWSRTGHATERSVPAVIDRVNLQADDLPLLPGVSGA